MPKTAASTTGLQGSISIQNIETIVDTDRFQGSCEWQNIKQKNYFTAGAVSINGRVYFNELLVSSPLIKEECLVQNNYGTFSDKYWSPSNNKNDMIEIYHTGGRSMRVVPGGNAVFITDRIGSDPTGTFRTSINYDFPATGKLAIGYRGNGLSARAYKKWTFTSSAPRLEYRDGSPMLVKQMAFSKNGKYAILALTSGYFVRINIHTKELTPIAKLPTAGSQWTLGISSDGNTALTRHKDGQLMLHNLNGCKNSYTEAYPLQNEMFADGCVATPIIKMIEDLYPGSHIRGMSKFTFSPNSASFTVDVVWFSGERKRVTIAADTYNPNVAGYLAMGDSFSSGEGDLQGGDWYEPGTDEQGNKETFEGRNLCHLSRRSYPYLMAVQLGYMATNTTTPPGDGLFHSVACSGAVIHNITGTEKGPFLGEGYSNNFEGRDNQYRNNFLGVLDRWQPGRLKQIDYLDSSAFGGYIASEKIPETITIGIGGNDAGFGSIVFSCIKPGTCKYAVEGSVAASELAQTIASLKDTLTLTYKSIKTASPDSRIYVHGYPVFVQGSDSKCGLNTPLDAREAAFVEKSVRYINSVVRAAAAEAGVFYVDVTDVLEGRNLCSGVADDMSAFNGATKGNDKLSLYDNKIAEAVSSLYIISDKCYFSSGCIGNESFHPNQIGHKLYASEILQQTNNLTNSMPEPTTQPYPVPDSFFGNLVIDHIRKVNEDNGHITDYETVIKQPRSFMNYKDQNTVKILQDGLYPGSTVTVSHQSEPTEIGQFTVGDTGVLDIDVVLPESLITDPGEHEIHLSGVDTFGSSLHYYQPISIANSADDFDGDGVLNTEDSCVTLPNIVIDQDQDGIDDVCDEQIVQEVAENQHSDSVDLDKGTSSIETVAGAEQIVTEEVLGASTTVETQKNETSDKLSTAGVAALFTSIIGILLVSAVFVVRVKKPAQD